MSRNNDIENDDDLELIDLANDHLAAADAGAREAKKKEKKRRAEKERSFAPIAVLIFLLLAALGFCGYLVFLLEGQKKALAEEKAARAEDAARFEKENEAALAVINGMNDALEGVEQEISVEGEGGVIGTISTVSDSVSEDMPSLPTEDQVSAQLSEQLEGIRSTSADDKEQYIRDIMMAAALKEGGGPMTAVRAVFNDMAFYTVDKDTYEFSPLLDNIPRNDIKEEQIVKDEDGTIHYMVDGVDKGIPMIDVSEYQGVIDWNAVASSGIKYAMLRAGFRGYGSGKLVLDKYFDDNIKGATAAGIKIGAYFFSEAITEAEAREEARAAIDHLAGYKVDLPIVVDVEHISYDEARADALDKTTRTDVTLAFVDEVKQAGYKPMLYAGLLVYFHYLDQSRINHLPLWYAFYSEYLYFPYKISCWQYTDSATVKGVNGKVDMSIWLVDPESL